MAEEFIGKKVRVEYVQEIAWKRPVKLKINAKVYKVKKVISRWEEHTMGRPWWRRKHRVWYEVLLGDNNIYTLYWDRGPAGAGRDWFLVKRLDLIK